jgi:alkaline phosphatase D
MIKRRHFLQATLATAGASIVGCGNGNSSSTSGGTTTSTEQPRKLEDGSKFFPQSVASGDPKPDSVILWTRVFDDTNDSGDLDLELELSSDPDFTVFISLDNQQRMKLKALAAFDHCVKVRLAGISPDTVYYYRFTYTKDGRYYVTKVGKTKTAPSPDADVKVRFAYVSCQDYTGRFYNSYLRMAKEPLDFFVHLGDYVYETDGDPTFQNTTGRKVTFTDPKSAIELKSADGKSTYHAAKSLSNYRDLYRTYRSDAALQAIHENVPMIATWDDHEFSDDCHGAVGTYFDGTKDETDVARRMAADQAWFEYMPVDYLNNPDFAYDPKAKYPGDIKIWRDFTFGKHLRLVMTDLRTYRADHIIPEEAFPGTVVVDQATLTKDFGGVPDVAKPYIPIDDGMWKQYKAFLTQVAMANSVDPAKVTGNISVAFINAAIAKAGAGAPPPIDMDAQMNLERGVAYIDAAKTSFFSSIGSRYFCIKPAFDIIAKNAYNQSKANQEVLGPEQEKWFLDTMTGAKETWKVWGNEYCLMPITIDLTKQPVPDPFKQVFYMDLDAWDGFRDKREELFQKLTGVGNVVAITGDIHAFYASIPGLAADPTKRVVEFTGSSISSGTYKTLLSNQVKADPVLSSIPAASLLASAIDTLLKTAANPHLGFADSGDNGFITVDVSSTEFVATYYAIKEAEVTNDLSKLSDTDLAAKFTVTQLKTVAGAADLYMSKDGSYKKWNPATLMYE